MLWIFKKKEVNYDWEFDWLCSSQKQCENFWKKLLQVFVSSENIWELERRLKRCNECYLKNWASHPTVKITRWNLSTEVHHYNSKNKRK